MRFKQVLIFLAACMLFPQEASAQIRRYGQPIWPHPPRASRWKLARFALGSFVDCSSSLMNSDWDECGNSIRKRAGFKDENFERDDWPARFPSQSLPRVEFYPRRCYDFTLKRKNSFFQIAPVDDNRKRIIKRAGSGCVFETVFCAPEFSSRRPFEREWGMTIPLRQNIISRTSPRAPNN